MADQPPKKVIRVKPKREAAELSGRLQGPPPPSHTVGAAEAYWEKMARQRAYDEWIDRAIAWLEERWGENRPCPYCANDSWDVQGAVELRPAPGFPQWSGDPEGFFPAFQVICTNCGHTALVNVMAAGLPFRERETE
ncbi:MAG: hypothetical protein ACJ76Z_13260 [Thermoleophilaceae bacterium]